MYSSVIDAAVKKEHVTFLTMSNTNNGPICFCVPFAYASHEIIKLHFQYIPSHRNHCIWDGWMKISNTLLWFNLLRDTYYHRKVFHNWSCKKSLHNLQKINTMSILRTAKWKSHCTIIFWTMHHNWRWIVHCVSYTDHIYIYILFLNTWIGFTCKVLSCIVLQL